MDLVKTFEEDELAGKPRGEVCLAPLNDDKALNELLKLGDQKSKLIERIQSIEAQVSARSNNSVCALHWYKTLLLVVRLLLPFIPHPTQNELEKQA